MFSVLGWLYGKRRTSLDTSTIESIAKIRHFYNNNSSNSSKKRQGPGQNEPEDFEDFQKLVDESMFFEDIEDENDESDGYKENLEHLEEIPNQDVYVLIEDYVDLSLFSAENNDGLM